MLVVGIALFTMGDVDARPSFDPQGVALIVAALFLDSFAANFEERRCSTCPIRRRTPRWFFTPTRWARRSRSARWPSRGALAGAPKPGAKIVERRRATRRRRTRSPPRSRGADERGVRSSASPSSSCSYGTSARPTRRSSRARGSWCPSRRAFCCTPSPWGGSTRGERRARCAACITSTS